jgi:hypothetical protein
VAVALAAANAAATNPTLAAVFGFAFIRPLSKRPAEIEQDEWSVVPVERPDPRRATRRDMAAVVAANLCSFGFGELLHATGCSERLLGAVL